MQILSKRKNRKEKNWEVFIRVCEANVDTNAVNFMLIVTHTNSINDSRATDRLYKFCQILSLSCVNTVAEQIMAVRST